MNTQFKRKYFSEKLTQFQGDLKKTWKTISQVINKTSSTTVVPCLTVDGQTVRGHKEIASSMNEYFCSIGNKLSEKIPRKANPLLSGEYAIETPPLSFSFSAIMTDKLSSTLNKMKTSHGSGHDGIASFYLKIALPVVGRSLCDLFNKLLFAGKFPEDWKIARIAPIFKGGAKDDRSNYRPISVLPFISRLFEKLIFNQFYEYLDANKSLYEHQSGFRLLHSVATALMASTNDWYLNIDKGKYTGLIFIDLKKAFDTVDREILLEKLKMYGVTGLDHDWFKSYLDNRKQFCRINGSSSDVKGINCGVPQGSCLGPLLFLIYINDLPFSLLKAHVSMYADDTTISLSSKSIGDLQNDLNLDLLKLQDWLHANKLSLNVVKTQSLIIGSGPNIRKSGKGGGVAAYISDKLTFNRRLDLENDELECIWVEMKPIKSSSYLIGVIYRPPDSLKHLPKNFNNSFDEMLKKSCESSLETILMGDVNVNYLVSGVEKISSLLSAQMV